jgi:hypothetical protein
MAQYQIGTVVATNGSAVVTGVDPDDPDTMAEMLWDSEVQAGDLFYIKDDPVAYVVQTVDSDTQLTLTANYQGTTVVPAGEPLQGAVYAVHRDFSTNYNFPMPSAQDIGLPVFLRLAMIDIDAEIKLLDDRITTLEP